MGVAEKGAGEAGIAKASEEKSNVERVRILSEDNWDVGEITNSLTAFKARQVASLRCLVVKVVAKETLPQGGGLCPAELTGPQGSPSLPWGSGHISVRLTPGRQGPPAWRHPALLSSQRLWNRGSPSALTHACLVAAPAPALGRAV